MAEATWREGATSSSLDWRMSAALENVPRGEGDLTEVTSLGGAVRAWTMLNANHREQAVLTPERPIQIDGTLTATFNGEGIAALPQRLPARQDEA